MKNFLLPFSLFVSIIMPALSQAQASSVILQKPRFIIGSGLGFHWFDTNYKLGQLNVEIPFNQYYHLGLNFAWAFSKGDQIDYYYDFPVSAGTYEIGIYNKYFPHGRFTGRKSGFFVGADLRLGSRKSSIYYFQSGQSETQIVASTNLKAMFNWGVQWRLGKHAIFEISAPIGAEHINYPSNANNYYSSYYSNRSNLKLVMLPGFMIGLAL